MSPINSKLFVKLDATSMAEILLRQNALTIHQVTLVDYLNSIESPEELSKNFVKDDPFHQGIGYGIGLKVAQSILQKRDKMDGFSSLRDLFGIPYFGVDKFNDLIYTFVNFHLPNAEKFGEEFYELLLALSRLELIAKQDAIPVVQFIGLLYTIFQDTDSENNDNDWSELFKGKTIGVKNKWEAREDFITDRETILKHRSLKIVNTETNFQHFIVALFGRLTDTDKGKSAFKSRLGLATYKYFGPLEPVNKLDYSHFLIMTMSHYHGMSDAIAMKFDENSSFVWNLLRYYTEVDSPKDNKFQVAAKEIGLGGWHSTWGKFYSDNEQLRTAWQKGVSTIAKFINSKNEDLFGVVSSAPIGTSGEHEVLSSEIVALRQVDNFIDVMSALVQTEKSETNFITWNRLEARPRTDDFTRPMYAEIRDPLWMLARQYQFGEFLGEDGGSAIESRVKLHTSKINLYSDNSGVSNFDDSEPLEMIVEKTSVKIDLISRLEMCRWWKKNIVDSEKSSILAELYGKDAVGIDEESWNLPDGADQNVRINSISQMLKNGSQFDGFKLYKSLKGISSAISFSGTTNGMINTLKDNFILWVERNYSSIYQTEQNAWNPERLEYAFKCSSPDGLDSTDVYETEEYANGHLDWYHLSKVEDEDSNSSLSPNNPDQSVQSHEHRTMVPTQINYPGMPLARWWQLENYKINFDKLAVNRTDSATLAFTEFVTLYSNDWLMIPFNIPAGSVCKIESIIIKDVFGQFTEIESANKNSADWKSWAMFDISDAASDALNNQVIIPPTLVKSLESNPFEEVCFMRDEMANMAWGIESKISDQLLGSRDGFEFATENQSNHEKEIDTLTFDEDVKIKYKLGSKVPENWIPLIPVIDQEIGEINFRRGSMVRPLVPPSNSGKLYERIRPLTSILSVNLDQDDKKYIIKEEEIPKSGIKVQRIWQRTRWYDGEVRWWASFKKRVGRGQGNSGLKWDVIEDIKE